jgi:hypothetical protein
MALLADQGIVEQMLAPGMGVIHRPARRSAAWISPAGTDAVGAAVEADDGAAV